MSTLGEHQGNGIRFDMHLSAPNGGVAQMLCRPEGQWVSWSEYDKLKAEVERLRKFNDEALAHIAKEERKSRERLDMAQADVERLIKAGDNLITALDKRDDVFDNSDKRQAIADWNAAKDASQA